METMMLVAGLAVAGLIGLAAAFYFSIRSGRSNKRSRAAGAGGAGSDRRPGSRSGGTARPDRTGHVHLATNGSRSANGSRAANAPSRSYQADSGTGPDPVLDSGDPRLGPAKPRRRVGLRKGSHVDEELWPTEAFGGVSDEQFWDDMASDKPLATTARTAQQDPGARKRPLDAVPPADTQAVPVVDEDRGREERGRGGNREQRGRGGSREQRGREERGRGEGRRSAGSGAYPHARTGPNPATERTAIQPAYAATQLAPSMPSQAPGVTQPVRPGQTQPVKTAAAASPPLGAPPQLAETRGRRRPSTDEEDPLTSAAFSLRPSGPVDGGSSPRSRDMTREQFAAAIAQETQSRLGSSRSGGSGQMPASSYDGSGGTSAYSYPATSHGDPSSATQARNTPLDGVNYGYAGASPADDAQRQNGTRSHARHSGTSEGTHAARQVYPQGDHQAAGKHQASGRHQATGKHQATGSYQADAHPAGGYSSAGYPVGGFQGNGYQGNGHRAPYDPREDYRRLTHRR
jgi:hypothetical protein